MSNDSSDVSHQVSSPNTADAVHAAMQFLRVLRYRKLYLITAIVVAGLLGAVYYLTATRIYQATATLLVTQTGSDVWNTAMSPEGSRDALIPTYERLFSSAVVLEGALEQLGKMPPETRVDFTGQPRKEWPAILSKNLSARGIRRTNLIEISVRSKSPQAATAVVGALVRSYLDFMDKNHKDVSVEIVTILDQERRQIEERLTEKQQELLEVQHRVRDLGLREGTTVVHPIVQRVVRLNEALVKVQEQRVQLEASLAAIRDAVRSGADLRQHLVTIEPIVGRELVLGTLGLTPQHAEGVYMTERKLIEDHAKLDTLLAHLGPAHPQVVELGTTIRNAEQYLATSRRQINQRLDAVHHGQLGAMLIAMVEQKLVETRHHENELRQQYVNSEAEAVSQNDRMAELQLAVNEVERLRNLQEALLNQISKIDISQNQADVRVAVVSEPTASDRPVSPKLSLVVLLCLVVGVGGGAAVVYVLDLLDDRFRSPEELKDQLGVPVLAMVRNLTPGEGTGIESLQVHMSPEAVESEAFRTLRTTLNFSSQELDRIAVTSSQPGDGKTTVLANLGVAFAQVGKRTLLIDADLRRPGLSKLLELRGVGGLSQVLKSDEDIASVCRQWIRPSGVERLDVLPSGPRPSDPAELLSGSRMQELIAWAESQYDKVLIDCPPMLAASDAAIVGRLVDGMVLVVQPQRNHRRAVLRATEDLVAMRVNLVGVVANRVGDEQGGGYYGYGTGYGYGYGYGYGSDEDDAPDEEESHRHGVETTPRRAA